MPIKVLCPVCAAPLTAPDEAAGKPIDCRECGTPMMLPRAPAAAWETPPAVAAVADEEADYADRRDDRPRDRGKKKKKRKQAKARIGLAVWLTLAAVGGVGLIVATIVVGILVYRKSLPTPEKEIAGVGWYRAEEPDGWFTAFFPGGPAKHEKFEFELPAFLADKAGANPEELGWKTQTWVRKDDGREYSILLFSLPAKGAEPGMAEKAVTQARLPPGPGVEMLVDEPVTVGKHTGRRMVARGGGQVRVSHMLGLGSRHLLLVVVTGEGSMSPTDPKVEAFFTNFTLNR